jgi:16S rRNA (guanine1516-N2)-methyltransferase
MRVAVLAEGRDSEQRAEELAARLGLELLSLPRGAEPPHEGELLLVRTPDRLELREAGRGAPGPVSVEFEPGRGSPLLRRAALAGKAGMRVIDGTAGLGQDAFALAEWGCEVELIERSAVVWELLADGLRRAGQDPSTRDSVARIRLHLGDALDLLPRLAPADVVYLDPMYPLSGREGRKAKGMRLLRDLLGGDHDADVLLEQARRAATRRVAVKRPLRAPPLAGERPSGSLPGTTVRYDLYGPLPARRPGQEG